MIYDEKEHSEYRGQNNADKTIAEMYKSDEYADKKDLQ